MLTKDQILSSKDLPVQEVEIPEWGGSVFVRTMNGFERDAFEQSIADGKKSNLANIRARFAAKVVVDAEGNRIFSDADAEELGKKSAGALGRIFDVGSKLNGLSGKDVEELEKNSGAAQSEDSTSD